MYHLTPDQLETEMEDAVLWLLFNGYTVTVENIFNRTSSCTLEDCREWLSRKIREQ